MEALMKDHNIAEEQIAIATISISVNLIHSLQNHNIAEEQIAIATGQTRGLEDVNLFDRIPLRIIITVQALREGWDCSFAYILCALAEQNSPRSVEQILGRVLRMPRAQKKKDPALNVAYAYAVEQGFVRAAKTLQDALIENGFQALEAKDFAVPQQASQGLFDDPALFGATEETVSEAPDLSNLPPDLAVRVTYNETTKTLAVVGPLSESHRAALAKCVSTRADKKAVERLHL
jgi:type III restriction enzyme